MLRTVLATAALGLAATAAQPVLAQSGYPTNPVTLLVPFGPGGTSDIMARLLQQPLAEALGTTVVVENRGGAGGAIGMSALARAKPDGYTIGLSVIGPEILQPSMRNTGYGPDDFEHLCGTYDVPLMMMVKPDSPYKSLADVIEDAKRKPGGLTYASSGAGTVLHLAMTMLLEANQAPGLHVPYKNSSEMVTALMGGQVDVFNDTPTISTQYRLRGLAVYDDKRLPAFPDVPTAAEAGFPLKASVWGGLIAPRGLPEPVRAKLEQACRDATHTEAYQRRAAQINTPLAYRDGQQYGRFVREEMQRYSRLIQETGLASQQ
ncbi:tripartite tricarboxylate transporter substrate binding protein [Orrella sp. JC864]|uniref:Bug family tripartite tricarboxylate transporter substrate binding protein n=1 Tax=Orrella sp. JC864 TaxID=3120298 RepID=UPI00300BD5EF